MRSTPRLVPSLAAVLLVAAALVGLGTTATTAAAPALPSYGAPSAGAPTGAAARTARPAACARNGRYVWSHLERCGWAGPRSTGARPARCPGDRLRRLGHDPRGTIVIRQRGKVLACRQVVGCLSIEAPGVRLRDVAVRCTSGRSGEAANGTGVVKVQNGASLSMSHVGTNGMRGVHACVWHQGTRLTVRALDCRHVNDGIFSWSDTGFSRTTGDHVTVKASYLHDFTTRTANGHVDGYQTEGASHILLQHNTWLMTTDDHNSSNSAIAVWDSMRDSTDVTVRHNLIAGGGFAVYAHDYSPSDAAPAGGYSVRDVQFRGNVFSRRLFGCVGYYGVWFPRGRPTDGWHRSGNRVLETGQRIDDRNPSSGGRTCT